MMGVIHCWLLQVFRIFSLLSFYYCNCSVVPLKLVHFLTFILHVVHLCFLDYYILCCTLSYYRTTEQLQRISDDNGRALRGIDDRSQCSVQPADIGADQGIPHRENMEDTKSER